MAFTVNFLVFILQWLGHSACLSLEQQNPLGTLDDGPMIRPVVEDDLDDFVTTYIDAFSPGPMWQYTHLNQTKFANYTWTCARAMLEEQSKHLHKNRTSISVIAVPQDNAKRPERVVSFAVWNWIYPGESIAKVVHHITATWMQYNEDSECEQMLDLNMTRMADLMRQFDRIPDPITHNSTKPQLYLSLLATHPGWDGHDFGATQVKAGLQKAEDKEAPVTLLATPAGYPLYDSLGFQSLENVTLTKLDDLGTLWFEFMRWEKD